MPKHKDIQKLGWFMRIDHLLTVCALCSCLAHLRNHIEIGLCSYGWGEPHTTRMIRVYDSIRPNTDWNTQTHTQIHCLIRIPDRDIVRRYWILQHIVESAGNCHSEYPWNRVTLTAQTHTQQKNLQWKLCARTVYAADFSSFKCTCKQLSHRFKNDSQQK